MNDIYELLSRQKETTLLTYIITANKDGTINLTIGGGNRRSVQFKKVKPDDSRLITKVVDLLLEYKKYEKWLEKQK